MSFLVEGTGVTRLTGSYLQVVKATACSDSALGDDVCGACFCMTVSSYV